MGEGAMAGGIFICVFLAALFLTLGIVPLVIYYRLKHGENTVAEVTEHLLEDTSTDDGAKSYNWFLKLKYFVNGAEYENRYNVIKSKEYMNAHSVGTTINILVDPKKPKRFVLPEDISRPLIPGIIFTIGGMTSLVVMIAMLINLLIK